MDNKERRENYERQRGTTKLTGRQLKRLRHRAGPLAHAHAPDVFINEKHKHVRVTRCDICRTPVPTSA